MQSANSRFCRNRGPGHTQREGRDGSSKEQNTGKLRGTKTLDRALSNNLSAPSPHPPVCEEFGPSGREASNDAMHFAEAQTVGLDLRSSRILAIEDSPKAHVPRMMSFLDDRLEFPSRSIQCLRDAPNSRAWPQHRRSHSALNNLRSPACS